MPKQRVSEFKGKTKPLFEGSRQSNYVRGFQFRLFENETAEFNCGFITQHSSVCYAIHYKGRLHMTNGWVDARNYLMRIIPDGFFIK